ncbi:MAG: zinc ribbon domain-containing protein [Ignavibacteriaceae bacterium]|nr:zinc ribbon domain-containing protein [Ignavibacteriaceae bacterium]
MPTYDYKCLECNHNFETFQSMKDKYLTECPKCGGNIKRLIGAGSGPIFKGSGFYQTDYKNPPPAKKATPAPAKVEKPTIAKTE